MNWETVQSLANYAPFTMLSCVCVLRFLNIHQKTHQWQIVLKRVLWGIPWTRRQNTGASLLLATHYITVHYSWQNVECGMLLCSRMRTPLKRYCRINKSDVGRWVLIPCLCLSIPSAFADGVCVWYFFVSRKGRTGFLSNLWFKHLGTFITEIDCCAVVIYYEENAVWAKALQKVFHCYL